MKNLDRLKQLYTDGFSKDSQAFVDYFFSKHIDGENNILTYSENGKIISAGYIVEKPAMIFGKEVVFPYLASISTDSQYRGRGKMKNILNKLFDTLCERGYSYFGLYPFNYLYYKRFSINDISFCKTVKINGGTNFDIRDAGECDYELLLSIYDGQSKNFDNKLIFTKDSYIKKLLEFAADNIKCSIISDKGHAFAFVFADVCNNYFEYYACTDFERLNRAENFAGFSYYDFSQTHSPYLQGRIIDAKKALLEYSYDKNLSTSINIQVYDADIKGNNFSMCLDIEQGRATLKKLTNINSNKNANLVLDIGILTQNMFCGGQGIFAKQKNLFSDRF